MECGAEATVTLPYREGTESFCERCAYQVLDQAGRDVATLARFLGFVQARPQCASAVEGAQTALEASRVRLAAIKAILEIK
jgi:hypothetical protein